MYYRWPVTAARTGSVAIPFFVFCFLQWVENVTDFHRTSLRIPRLSTVKAKIKTSPFRRVYRQNAAAFFATEPTFSAAESPVVSEDEGRRVGECISQQTAPSSTSRLPVFITQYQLSVWLRKLLRSLPRYVTHVVLRTHRGHMTKHMGCLFSLWGWMSLNLPFCFFIIIYF